MGSVITRQPCYTDPQQTARESRKGFGIGALYGRDTDPDWALCFRWQRYYVTLLLIDRWLLAEVPIPIAGFVLWRVLLPEYMRSWHLSLVN